MKAITMSEVKAGQFVKPNKRARYEYRITKIIELNEDTKKVHGDGDYLLCADCRRSMVNQKIQYGSYGLLAARSENLYVVEKEEEAEKEKAGV